MALITIGTALENLFQFAQSKGWRVEFEEPHPPALAVVRLVSCDGSEGEIDPVIWARTTNRNPYDSRRLPAELVQKLRAGTETAPGVSCQWVTERDRLAALAIVIGRADALLLENASLCSAFLDNLRLDAADESDGSIRLLPWVPEWVFSRMGASRLFEGKTRSLVSSASGLFVVFEEDSKSATNLLAGRLVERAWLELTREKLTAQPMMSLAILDAIVLQKGRALLDATGLSKAQALLAQIHNLIPEAERSSVAFILRFGYAPLSGVPARRREATEKVTGITV